MKTTIQENLANNPRYILPIKYPNNSNEFFHVLRQRVYAYFDETGQSRYANSKMYAQTLLMLFIWAGFYGLMLSDLFQNWSFVLLQCGFHFFSFALWVQVAHDAHHNAFTPNKRFNNFIFFFGGLLGVSSYVMDYNHVRAHHSAVNVPHHDVSIDSFSVLRFHPDVEYKWFHRYQAFYIWVLYGLATLFKLVLFDYFTLMRKSIGAHQIERHPIGQIIKLTLIKMACIFYTVVLPCLILHTPIHIILIGFVIAHFVSGIGLSVIFQVTHLCDYSMFTNVNKATNKMDNTFAIHVLENTSSFATDSWFVSWIGGGLNCHTIHHLFPEICQVHFMPLSKILRTTCREYGVPFKEYRSTWDALRSHVRVLHKLGKKGPYQPLPFKDWPLHYKSKTMESAAVA